MSGPLMVRSTDPVTSVDAALVAQRSAPSVREQCLLALREAGDRGLTDHELGARVNRLQTSAGVRRKELERLGLVEGAVDADGQPVRRPTPAGSTALVWRATELEGSGQSWATRARADRELASFARRLASMQKEAQ